MSQYILDVTNGSDKGSIVADAGFSYTNNLNQVNEANIKISGSGSNRRGLLTIGATIQIYRNGTLEFLGLIDNTDYFVGGTVVFHASGYEVWLGKEPGTYANSPYTSTASATIFSEIIAESAYFSAGTINAGFATDYRIASSTKLFNAITNLSYKTQQDLEVDYTNLTIGILDHLGSSSVVATLNEGKEITNVRRSVGYPRGNNIEVFGKGDGTSQIKGSASDGTSIAAYGTIHLPVVDRTLVSTAEANRLANATLALNKDPPNIYDFELTNPDYGPLTLGDHIELNALDMDANNVELRIVGIKRGDGPSGETTSLQVTNPELKTLMLNQQKALAKVVSKDQDTQTYMQGSGNTNTWGSGINAKTSYPLKIGFYLPASYITDEAGNSNVKELTVSYDIDAYKSQFGTASFDGTDPQVQNNSGDTQPDVENSSGSIGATVNNSSGNTEPDVENSSASIGSGVSGTSADSGGATWSTSYSGNSAGTGSGTLADSSWTTITDTGTIGLSTDIVLYFATFKNSNAINNRTIRMRANMNSTYYPDSGGTWTNLDAGDYATIIILMPVDVASQDIVIQAQTQSGDMDYEVTWNWQAIGKHTHADGSYAAASHSHTSGTYNAASHSHDDGTYAAASHAHDDGTYNAANHGHPDGTYDVNASDLDNISIGDDVAEAGAVNAASVNLYLDFYNTGTSNWDNKHSIMGTGVIIGTDVDMTNSSTYPDAAGYWRIRVEPITATADFAQGIVKIKNSVDN